MDSNDDNNQRLNILCHCPCNIGHTLSQNILNSRIKNRAFGGWRGCNSLDVMHILYSTVCSWGPYKPVVFMFIPFETGQMNAEKSDYFWDSVCPILFGTVCYPIPCMCMGCSSSIDFAISVPWWKSSSWALLTNILLFIVDCDYALSIMNLWNVI